MDMGMGLTSSGMMSMGMTMTSGGSSATSSAMPGMDQGSSMMMPMSDMMMVFFTSISTPLFSASWMPTNEGQYAGTCIFLIVLSVIFRGLIALRSNFALLYVWITRRNDTIVLRSEPDDQEDWKLHASPRRPWDINEALLRASLDTVLAGTSYLLMLAVMTMNVGYFMSVLGGTFLGSFVIGGWTPAAAH